MLCISAFLASLSIVLGKYLAINLGDTIRISYENLPLLFAGLYFGPITGMLVGIVADLLGCVLVGYSINPIITLGAAVIGLTAGLMGKLIKNSFLRTFLAVFFAHAAGSILIKTVGLYLYFKMPFWATFGMRSMTYLIIGVSEFLILFFLSRSKALTKETKKLIQKGDGRHDVQ